MHARHRTPGEAARGNSFGIGHPSNRGSPDSGLRHFSHSSDYKGSGRGTGRGAPRPLHHARKSNIMMEAGRLAAEYLVSQGLLPANSLVQKGQNNVPAAHLCKDGPEIRVSEREVLANENGGASCARYNGLTMEASGSSLTGRDEEGKRRGSGSSEMLSGGRKLPDYSLDSKTQFKNSRKLGSFKGVGQDWNSGDSRSGPILEKGCEISTSKESVDGFAGYQAEKRVAVDVGGVPKPVDSRSCKSGLAGDSDSDLENYEFPNTTDSRTNDLFGTEDPLERKPDKIGPHSSATIDRDDRSLDDGELRDSFLWNEKEMQHPLQQQYGKTDALSKDSRGSSPPDASKGRVSNEEDLISKLSDQSISPRTVDMLQLCRSEQVPTKARSIKKQKVSEVEHGFEQRSLPMPEGRHLGEFLSGRGSSSSRDDDVDESGKSYWSLRGSGSDSFRIRTDRSIEEAGELDPSLAVERDRFSKSYSFSERSSFIHQQESGRWPPGFGGLHGRDSVSQNERIYPYGRSRSMYHQREMESSVYRANRWEGTKRQREWPSARVSQADEYFRLHNLKAKLSSAPVKGAPSVDEEVSKNVEREEVSEEKVSVKKDLNEIVTSKAVFSDSGSKEEGPLSAGSKIIDEKVDLNIQTAEDNEDPNAFASEKQKACVQIANLLTRIHKGSSDEVSKPVLEEECPIEGSQKNEGKVLDAETESNAAEKDEGSIHAFFLDLLRGYPNLRKLYQSQDNSKGFDCLVCLSSSPINEMKFSSLVNLLKHTKDGNETLLIHKGYGHAICDLLELDNSNSLSKDVESNELQTEQPLPNEEGTGNTTEPESPSLEGAKSDGPEE